MKIEQLNNLELNLSRQHKKCLCRWLETKRDTAVVQKKNNTKVQSGDDNSGFS